MSVTRACWTLWALVPVGVVAFHFGPGQHLASRDVAVLLHATALEADQLATATQERAYAAHLAAIEARRAVFLDDAPALVAALESTIETERVIYDEAADSWQDAADAYQQVEEVLADRPGPDLERVRLSKSRALVRSGDIWAGVGELETLLEEFAESGRGDSPFALETREELAGAHYFGARLLRLAGEPAEDWRAEAAKARQHFRFLAERAADRSAAQEAVRGLEDNVERVLDLEQEDRSELEGKPLPRQSPRVARGNRPGRGNRDGKSKRPPTGRDGRGAGGAGPIGPGN